ncbi:MAG: hypothetical protein P1P84_22155 [Deferrisomatales bacterium]|nr:hypothetical protein [Deferrisomatales bacterium]
MADQDNADHTTFDMGSADEIATCTSCHMGGGPYEVDRNGNRYDSFFAANRAGIEAGDFGTLNGDYFRYELDAIAAAPFNWMLDALRPSPALSAPKLHDWSESGVLEAECLTCHLDPLLARLTTADGVQSQNYSPRLQVFVVAKMNAARNDYADVYAMSFGRYPDASDPGEVPAGYEIFSASRYSSPLPPRDYVASRFYAAENTPGGTTRDAVKVPILEGGMPDEVLLPAGQSGSGFKMHNAYDPGVNKVFANGDTVWGSRKFLGYYFKYAATGGLMGLDLDGDGIPLAYVRLVKKPGVSLADLPATAQNYFDAETYYDPDDLARFAAATTEAPILASDDTGGQKWDLVCARCHVAFTDPVNQGLYMRPDIMGMKADVPKRGTFWKMDYTGAEDYDALLAAVASGEKSPAELAGYDVHAARGVECVDCHASQAEDRFAPDHNFGKGIDTGGTVRNDLDFQKVKVCRDCHQESSMIPRHGAIFRSGELTVKHFEAVACESCHIPQKRYWAFRTFDYTMGFSYNFDSRFMPNPADPGNVAGMTPFSAFSGFGIVDPQPGYYAAAPFYGIGGLQWVGQSNPLYGMDVVTSIAYFDPAGPDTMVASQRRMNGLRADFVPFSPEGQPLRPMDPYAMFYNMMTDPDGVTDTSSPQGFMASANGKSYFELTPVLYRKPDRNGVLKLYPTNPVAEVTWVDYDPADPASMKVLYARELNSILAGAVSREIMPGRSQVGVVLTNSAFTRDPATGAITVTDPATIIWDDNLDLRPEISNETELDQVRSAIEQVLAREDEYAGVAGKTHHLKLAVLAHNFTISHNVLPKSQALGQVKDYDALGGVDPATGAPLPAPGNVRAGATRQCVDCHAEGPGDMDVMMNARLTNRRVTFVPWTIQGFDDLVARGKVWVEPEIGFIHPIDANGDGDTEDVAPDFSRWQPDGSGMLLPGDYLGATQAEVIEHTEEAAAAFAKLAGLTPVHPGEEAEAPEEAPAAAEPAGRASCFLGTLLIP